MTKRERAPRGSQLKADVMKRLGGLPFPTLIAELVEQTNRGELSLEEVLKALPRLGWGGEAPGHAGLSLPEDFAEEHPDVVRLLRDRVVTERGQFASHLQPAQPSEEDRERADEAYVRSLMVIFVLLTAPRAGERGERRKAISHQLQIVKEAAIVRNSVRGEKGSRRSRIPGAPTDTGAAAEAESHRLSLVTDETSEQSNEARDDDASGRKVDQKKGRAKASQKKGRVASESDDEETDFSDTTSSVPVTRVKNKAKKVRPANDGGDVADLKKKLAKLMQETAQLTEKLKRRKQRDASPDESTVDSDSDCGSDSDSDSDDPGSDSSTDSDSSVVSEPRKQHRPERSRRSVNDDADAEIAQALATFKNRDSLSDMELASLKDSMAFIKMNKPRNHRYVLKDEEQSALKIGLEIVQTPLVKGYWQCAMKDFFECVRLNRAGILKILELQPRLSKIAAWRGDDSRELLSRTYRKLYRKEQYLRGDERKLFIELVVVHMAERRTLGKIPMEDMYKALWAPFTGLRGMPSFDNWVASLDYRSEICSRLREEGLPVELGEEPQQQWSTKQKSQRDHVDGSLRGGRGSAGRGRGRGGTVVQRPPVPGHVSKPYVAERLARLVERNGRPNPGLGDYGKFYIGRLCRRCLLVGHRGHECLEKKHADYDENDDLALIRKVADGEVAPP